MKVFGEDLSKRTILIIGAGKMGETTLKHLTKHGAKSVLVANRSMDRALELVARFDGRAVPFADLPQALAQADVVVSSTSAPHFVLSKADVATAMNRRSDRALLLIDLAVPRDIDPAALQVPSVYLYNIDQLAEMSRINMERRQSEAAACEKLVAEHSRQVAAVLSSRSPGTDNNAQEAQASPHLQSLSPLLLSLPYAG
jgi:glutamyl-tRNA reductase